jgi:hypothetical protein
VFAAARIAAERRILVCQRGQTIFTTELRMTLSEASLLAFTVFSGLRLISYVPQICRVARDENGASAISYATWALWTGNNISTGIYAATNLNDLLLAGASILYALCCVAVIAITASKRHRALRHATLKTSAVSSR